MVASYSKHAMVSKQYWLHKPWLQGSHLHPYSYHRNILKLIILHLNTVNNPSPMFEGVAKIWINNQPSNGINLTTRHTWATESTQVAIVHDVVKESGRVLPHPSGIFHAFASADTPCVDRHYPVYIHKQVRYLPAQWHMKLLSLGIPYVPYASVYSSACSTRLNRCGSSPTQVEATTLEFQISDQTTHPPSHPVFFPFT
jgi:hypothetical protein